MLCGQGRWLVALVLVGACGDEQTSRLDDEGVREYAESFCAMMFSCDCRNTVHSSESACLEQTYGAMRARQLQARGDGWVYDDACLRSRIEVLERTACESPLSERERCNFFHGDQGEGEPCVLIHAGMSDCERDLSCGWGVCYNPDDPHPSLYLAEGEDCFAETPEGGQILLGLCAPGQHCDHETHRCIRTPELGEACSGDTVCDQGYCEAEVCVPQRSEGEACSHWTQCHQSDCVDDVCTRTDPVVCRNFFP
jgi:hypothetical protein